MDWLSGRPDWPAERLPVTSTGRKPGSQRRDAPVVTTAHPVYGGQVSRAGSAGRRQLIAVITQPEVIVAFLESLGLPTRAPPLAPAREFDPDEASLF